MGRIVQAWGFSFSERTEPDSAMLAALMTAAHAPVDITDGHIVKADPATELDFNAIAQGYSVDLLARMMDSLGVEKRRQARSKYGAKRPKAGADDAKGKK